VSDDVRRVRKTSGYVDPEEDWAEDVWVPDADGGDVVMSLEDYRFLRVVCDDWHRQVDDLLVEVQRLRAEVERLKSREITDEQIDAAWEVVRVPANAYAARQTLASFRVFPCKECGGSGKFPDRVQAWDIPGAPVPECERCNGHGWIREEHGDE
jgi:hypothetical protein